MSTASESAPGVIPAEDEWKEMKGDNKKLVEALRSLTQQAGPTESTDDQVSRVCSCQSLKHRPSAYEVPS